MIEQTGIEESWAFSLSTSETTEMTKNDGSRVQTTDALNNGLRTAEA